jgi:site-specific DNA recombinase
VESSGSKYNGRYLLGNLLVCGDCGASYRRRMERGKVVWRCATRIEKGKDACHNSPTLNEGWVQDVLAEAVCQNEAYDEGIVRNEVDKIQAFDAFILISRADGSQEKRLFKND